ncbi:MAG: PspC domain-containing protein [Pelolinea sp.]|nr:PspC domain-containing protein [Pelolinea sp.]
MKRLYRDRSDVMVAGVCSGISKYLDVDPTAIRLVFVLLFFIGGGGLWIYLVLWVIMPFDPGHEQGVIEVEPEGKKAPEPKKIAQPKQAAEKKPVTTKAPVKKPDEKMSAEKPTQTKKPTIKPESSEEK